MHTTRPLQLPPNASHREVVRREQESVLRLTLAGVQQADGCPRPALPGHQHQMVNCTALRRRYGGLQSLRRLTPVVPKPDLATGGCTAREDSGAGRCAGRYEAQLARQQPQAAVRHDDCFLLPLQALFAKLPSAEDALPGRQPRAFVTPEGQALAVLRDRHSHREGGAAVD